MSKLNQNHIDDLKPTSQLKPESTHTERAGVSVNCKQKLGYTALGAAIALIGIGAGIAVSSMFDVRPNAPFGEIQCTKLTVIDPDGNPCVVVYADDKGNGITIYDKLRPEKQAVKLHSLLWYNRRTEAWEATSNSITTTDYDVPESGSGSSE